MCEFILIAYCNILYSIICFVDEMVEIEGVPQIDIAATDTTSDDNIVQDTVMESDATSMEDVCDNCTTAGTTNAGTITATPDGHVLQSISALSG